MRPYLSFVIAFSLLAAVIAAIPASSALAEGGSDGAEGGAEVAHEGRHGARLWGHVHGKFSAWKDCLAEQGMDLQGWKDLDEAGREARKAALQECRTAVEDADAWNEARAAKEACLAEQGLDLQSWKDLDEAQRAELKAALKACLGELHAAKTGAEGASFAPSKAKSGWSEDGHGHHRHSAGASSEKDGAESEGS